jgi:transposase
LSQRGWSQTRIADALGVTVSAVSQWLKRARTQDVSALHHRLPSGRPTKLTAEQRAQLLTLLDQGSQAFGFPDNLWTTKRVAWLIQQHFGVSYHPAHVSRLLRALGWTPQVPDVEASQRDAEAIAEWTETRLPALQKRPKRKDARSSS